MKKSTIVFFVLFAVHSEIVSQERGFLYHLSDYIENTSIFELGQEEGRAFYIPDNNLSLNGNWKFFYSDTCGGIPKDFYTSGFDDSKWKWIPVPSNWEMQGYGDKLFRNISTTYSVGRPVTTTTGPVRSPAGRSGNSEFTVIPPKVPAEYNPSGAYRKTFVLPPDWAGKEVFLRFEKVASAFFIWVNGKEAGYNEGAHEPSEYNISRYLRQGENTIAVFVVKFSDGYYLEGQDYWRLAGIFGDVRIYPAPQVRIFDWQVITSLDENYKDADLTLKVDVKSSREGGYNFRIKSAIKKGNKEIAGVRSNSFTLEAQGKKTISLTTPVKSPDKWTSETPALYDMVIELTDGRGKTVDRIITRIGFKETEIRGNTFFLNGVPIKIHGINSHMQHPETGHMMDEATIRRDFEILKQFNFNAVRTSHYPPVNKYLELADEYGIYIIDETGDESHATEYVSEMPEFTEMYRERVRKMVLRDRNHPCVLFWSAGNESGEGSNITEVIREGKQLDPSRFWMYGGNAPVHPAEDIIGPRYPTPIELEINIGRDTVDKRPSFMDEYLAVTGNGGGGLDDYWRVIYSHPRIMGGAIWDFVSPGLKEPVRKLEDKSLFHTPAHIMGNAKLTEGRQGKAIDLNGHDQWVEVYRSENVEITGEKLTLTMEVYPRSLVSSSGSFLTKGNYQFGLQQNGKKALDFYLFNGKKQILTSPLPDNWENHWHHLMATYNGSQMKIFIDGAEVASKETTGAIQNLPFPVNVGRNAEIHDQGTAVYTCDAIIDNVGIFKNVMDPKSVFSPEGAVLWLDFEKETREGSFFSIGIGARTYGTIWPDRRPQPEMWQMKKSAQPLSFTLLDSEKGMVEVWNRSNFTDASHWNTTWTLTEDDKVLQSGKLDLRVAPQSRSVVSVPYTKPMIQSGKEYRLNISAALREEESWAPRDHEVAWDQMELKNWSVTENRLSENTTNEVRLDTTREDFIISGVGFAYKFDRKGGALRSIAIRGSETLGSPLKLSIWRAPLANETDQWNSRTLRSPRWKEGYGTTISTDYYSNGIHQLKFIPLEVMAREINGKVNVHVRELALVDGGAMNIGSLDMYISGKTLSGFENIYNYVVSGDGKIVINHRVMPQGSMPAMLPRIGLTLALTGGLNRVEYYGRGPQENYPDRKSGYRIGIYQSTVQDMYEPYLIPQDYGLRTDNRWVTFKDEKGKGLKFSMNEYFNFNAYPFTTDNLTKALYTYQLQESGNITLNLDYNTTGVGCTARPVLDSYRVYPESYSREIIIQPLNMED